MSATGASLGSPTVSQNQHQQLFAAPHKRLVLLGLLIVLGTIVLYQPLQSCGFINYDDPIYVKGNIPVQNGLTWKSIRWAFTTTTAANWHPIAWLSHMLDVSLFGMNPAGHHLSSVFYHAINSLLLLLVLWRFTGKMGRSFAVAAIFAVHPLNLQSLAWISERKNLLCMTFWLLGLLAYWYYAQRPNWRRYLLVGLALALALMSKPMAVTFPFVLLLLDGWPLGRISDLRNFSQIVRLTIEKIPLLALCAGDSLLTYLIQRSAGANQLSMKLPLYFRTANSLDSYVMYLRQLFWPKELAIFYPHPIASLPARELILAGVILSLISWLAWRHRDDGYPLVGWLWYLGTLVPVIGIVQVGVQARADRYMYIPMVGILIIVVWGFAKLTRRFAPPWLGASLLAIVVVALSLDTFRQIPYWRDSVDLFTRAIQISPVNNYVSYANLADGLTTDGRYREAVPYYQYVLAKFPEAVHVRTGLANCLRMKGDLKAAEYQADVALKDASYDPELESKLYELKGVAREQAGDHKSAEENFKISARIDPNSYAAHINLGMLFLTEGRNPEALAELEDSVQIFPTDVAYVLLGQAYVKEGAFDQARSNFEQALRMSPGNREARDGLAELQRPAK